MTNFLALSLLRDRKPESLFDSTQYHSHDFVAIAGDGPQIRYVKYPKRRRRIPQLWEYNVSTEEKTMLVDFGDVFGFNWEVYGFGFAATGVDPYLALAVESPDKRLTGVWLVSLAGRAATRVADEPNAHWPQLSPDGKLMSFVNSDGDLIVLDVSAHKKNKKKEK